MPRTLKPINPTVFLEPAHTQTLELLCILISWPRLILSTSNSIILSVHHPTLPCSRGRTLQAQPITINRDISLATNATSHLEWVG